MPGEVQCPDGNTGVNAGHPWQDVIGQSVFPGAGKEHEGIPGCKLRLEGGAQFVHVLADTRTLSKRRAIIEQNPHARGIVPRLDEPPYRNDNSLQVNGLTVFFSLC